MSGEPRDAEVGGHAFSFVIAAARSGEGWAFTALFEWLRRPVSSYIGSRGLADPGPVINETFLGAFRGLHRFEGGAEDFRRWVFGIARHKIIDARRAESRRPNAVISVDDLTDEQVAVEHVEHQALANLGTERVQQLFAQLTEDQRDVLVLRLVSDMSIPQIAATLGKPEGAVKALQRRALRRLGQVLESERIVLDEASEVSR